MFVVPCKYDGRDFIFNCIDSIRKIYPHVRIAVCDSNSEDQSYLGKLHERYDNIATLIENNNYMDSAIWKCLERFPFENDFWVVQDSTILHQNIDFVKSQDFYSFMYFGNEWDSQEQIDWVKSQLNRTNIKFSTEFNGLFGTMIFTKRHVLENLQALGLDKCLPTNKMQSSGSERLWSIALQQIGINPAENSLVGSFTLNGNVSGNEKISKVWGGRV